MLNELFLIIKLKVKKFQIQYTIVNTKFQIQYTNVNTKFLLKLFPLFSVKVMVNGHFGGGW